MKTKGTKDEQTRLSEDEAEYWLRKGYTFGLAVGRNQAQFEGLGQSIGLPGQEIATRVGKLLIGTEVWKALGEPNRVFLRQETTERIIERGKVEVVVRPQKQAPGKVKIGRPPGAKNKPKHKGFTKGHSGWEKFKTKAARSAELVRRKEVARKNKEADRASQSDRLARELELAEA